MQEIVEAEARAGAPPLCPSGRTRMVVELPPLLLDDALAALSHMPHATVQALDLQPDPAQNCAARLVLVPAGPSPAPASARKPPEPQRLEVCVAKDATSESLASLLQPQAATPTSWTLPAGLPSPVSLRRGAAPHAPPPPTPSQRHGEGPGPPPDAEPGALVRGESGGSLGPYPSLASPQGYTGLYSFELPSPASHAKYPWPLQGPE